MVSENSIVEDNFQTHETKLAAFLKAIGGQYLHMTKSGRKYTFFFYLTSEQREAIPHFFDDTLKVGALTLLTNYVDLIRDIKDEELESGNYQAGNRR